MSKHIAIITGASSGIGKAFLEEIANDRGVNGATPFDEIWAVARSEDKLIEIKTLLGDDRIVPVTADLSSPEDMTRLSERLASEKPQIGLLINCAGMGMKGLVEDHPAKTLEDTIDVNCTSLAKLTRICIPYMIVRDLSRTRDKRPRIINIASSAGFLPQPGFAAYAASKAFVISFSRALYYELKDHRIMVPLRPISSAKLQAERKLILPASESMSLPIRSSLQKPLLEHPGKEGRSLFMVFRKRPFMSHQRSSLHPGYSPLRRR